MFHYFSGLLCHATQACWGYCSFFMHLFPERGGMIDFFFGGGGLTYGGQTWGGGEFPLAPLLLHPCRPICLTQNFGLHCRLAGKPRPVSKVKLKLSKYTYISKMKPHDMEPLTLGLNDMYDDIGLDLT